MKSNRESLKIFENSRSGAALGLFANPPSAKMAQDASLVASGAPFLEILGFFHLGAKMGKESAKMGKVRAKLAPIWPTWD